jgi:hypothetical protein
MMEVGYPLTAGNRQIAWRVLLPWRRHREWRTDVADYIMLRHASHCGTKDVDHFAGESARRMHGHDRGPESQNE